MSTFIRSVVEQLFGEITDLSDGSTFIACPGKSYHTSRNNNKDCRVYYQNGVPTVFCLHSSCLSAVEQANFKLRSTFGKLEAGANVAATQIEKTPQQLAREQEDAETKQLAQSARVRLAKIIAAYPWPPEQIYSDSPEGVADDPREDWRLIVSTFNSDDTLWIGDKRDSGSIRYVAYFRAASKWLASGICPKGPFIFPGVLKSGVWSRRKEDIARLPYLVVESDILKKDEIGAIFKWLRDVVRLPLVAVVDTAKRSLHGWFVRPDAKTLRDLRAVLPALGCDDAVLRDTQPVRLPGCQRPGTKSLQTLLYLDRKAAQ